MNCWAGGIQRPLKSELLDWNSRNTLIWLWDESLGSAEQQLLIFCWINWGLQFLLETPNNNLEALQRWLIRCASVFPIYLLCLRNSSLCLSHFLKLLFLVNRSNLITVCTYWLKDFDKINYHDGIGLKLFLLVCQMICWRHRRCSYLSYFCNKSLILLKI